MLKRMKVITISDGTGETAAAMCRAALTQFEDRDVYFTRYKNVRTKKQIEAIFTEAAIHHDLIVYTIVSLELSEYVAELSRSTRVRALDLMGPLLTTFSNYFNQAPQGEPGLLHQVNDSYFKRVEAMEFTLNHDDGKHLESLHLANVILVGISRTSKTPLSLYLSLHGIKVVNIPLIMGMEIPEELFKVDQRKIFALTIDSEALQEIREQRLSKLGAKTHTGDYASSDQVIKEVEWANQLFKENKRWPVFNVTGKALEETATDILKLLNMRKNNIFKQRLRKEQDQEG